MREETTTRQLYTFDELSESAKERARDWWREGMQSPDDWQADSVIDDAARLFDMIGLNIRTRPVKLMGGGTRNEPDVYWSLGRDRGLSFKGSYSYRKGGLQALAAEAPKGDGKVYESNNEINAIAETLQAIQKRNFYQVQASSAHQRHYGIDVDIERADGKPISEADIDATREALDGLADWLLSSLEREWEYQNSNEAIDETIRANEYEFTEDGRRA